jgi:uncharacterized membrane protein YeaQ/YmgE (transglycosylase-associated protein family)
MREHLGFLGFVTAWLTGWIMSNLDTLRDVGQVISIYLAILATIVYLLNQLKKLMKDK